MHRYKTFYNHVTSYDILLKDHFINPMQLPKFNSIVLNMGLGQNALTDKKQIITSLLALELITSQKSYQTRSKKAIDKFKLRKNMLIGAKVTLRNNNMFSFLDNFTFSVLPSLDNFSDLVDSSKKSSNLKKYQSQNFKRSFSFYNHVPFFNMVSFVNTQKKANYYSLNFGLDDYFSFPNIPYDKFASTSKNFGFNVTVNLNFTKRKKSNHLVFPSYFLNAFQLPIGTC